MNIWYLECGNFFVLLICLKWNDDALLNNLHSTNFFSSIFWSDHDRMHFGVDFFLRNLKLNKLDRVRNKDSFCITHLRQYLNMFLKKDKRVPNFCHFFNLKGFFEKASKNKLLFFDMSKCWLSPKKTCFNWNWTFFSMLLTNLTFKDHFSPGPLWLL